MGGLQALLVLAGLLTIYFFPTLMALRVWSGTGAPPKKNVSAIFALNLLLGWTFVGWVIALVWALTKDQDAVPSNVLARHTTEYQTATPEADDPFKAEAVLKGFPYRVRKNGTIEAMMTGGLVRFRDMEQFRAAAEGRDAAKTGVLKGFPYRVQEDGTIEAVMRGGLIHFRDMEEFRAAAEGRDAAQQQRSDSALEEAPETVRSACMIRIIRRSHVSWAVRSFNIFVNGRNVGTIARNSVLDIQVPSGLITIEARIDFSRSQPLTIEARPGKNIEIEVSVRWIFFLSLKLLPATATLDALTPDALRKGLSNSEKVKNVPELAAYVIKPPPLPISPPPLPGKKAKRKAIASAIIANASPAFLLVTIAGVSLAPILFPIQAIFGTVICGIVFAHYCDDIRGPYWMRGMLFGIGVWFFEAIIFLPISGAGFFGINWGPYFVIVCLLLFLLYGALLGSIYNYLLPRNRWVLRYAGIIAILLTTFIVFRTFAYQPFDVTGGGAKPTLLPGDLILVTKSSYGYSHFSLPFSRPLFSGRILAHEPSRGDRVDFRNPKDTSSDRIGRIVGLPGDNIQVIDGHAFINGVGVKREPTPPFIETTQGTSAAPVRRWKETMDNGVSFYTLDLVDNGFADNTQIYKVPLGHYFMMGDNRDNSTDSRFNQVGMVPFENIVGRVEIIFFSIYEGEHAWEFWRWPVSVRQNRIFTSVRPAAMSTMESRSTAATPAVSSENEKAREHGFVDAADQRTAQESQIVDPVQWTARLIELNARHTVQKLEEARDRAIQSYDNSIGLDPNNSIAYIKRANAYCAKGKTDVALIDIDMAIRLSPTTAEAYVSRGFIYESMGDHDRAIQDYDEAIRIDPKNSIAYSNRANAYRLKGDLDRALEDLDTAIGINPNNIAAHSIRSVIYSLKNDHGLAIAEASEAIRLAPTNAEVVPLPGTAG